MRAICPEGGANMAKISANYEVVYVLDPAQGEEAIAAQVANFKTLAEQNGSDVKRRNVQDLHVSGTAPPEMSSSMILTGTSGKLL